MESEPEFPKLQVGAFPTLAKGSPSCALLLFCLVQVITIAPYCPKRFRPFSSGQSTDPTIFLGSRSCRSYDLVLNSFDKKCQLQHDHHSLWPELLTWDMKKNKEVGSWVFSTLNECSISQKAIFSHQNYIMEPEEMDTSVNFSGLGQCVVVFF